MKRSADIRIRWARHPGVEAERAKIGFGLHARRAFRKGTTISRIAGRVHHWRVLLRRGGAFLDNCFRFGNETYLDPGSGPGRYLNHSCSPNAGIRKRAGKLFLFAARRIRQGEEVVVDYSTITGDDDVWRMKCHCGSRNCRGWVSRFGLLPRTLRASYFRRGLVSPHMYWSLEEPPTG